MAKFLINMLDRENINVGSPLNMTPFMWACKEGNIEIVKILVDILDKDEMLLKDSYIGYTGYMWACHCRHIDVVKLLNSKGIII